MPRKALHWSQYPRRICLKTKACTICGKPIIVGEFYADGGQHRKAHTECADKVEDCRREGR
jgi:hypothetical protein